MSNGRHYKELSTVELQRQQQLKILSESQEQYLVEETDSNLRDLFEALTHDKQVYAQVFCATRNPLIACQAAAGNTDDKTIYYYATEPTTQTYIAGKLQSLMPIAASQYSSADKMITYERKVSILVECLDDLSEMQAKKKSVLHIDRICRVISELNKMQGHYAPQKHLAITANLSDEEKEQVRFLIQNYEREY